MKIPWKNRSIQRELSAKLDDGFFWIGPDLYLRFVLIDAELAEVWVTRDSWGEARRACLVKSEDERKMFEHLSEEKKLEILDAANKYLTKVNEIIVREGDSYAIE